MTEDIDICYEYIGFTTYYKDKGYDIKKIINHLKDNLDYEDANEDSKIDDLTRLYYILTYNYADTLDLYQYKDL